MKPLKLTDAEIDAKMSPRGGFTRATLAQWNVPWPPPSGWRRALISGLPIPGYPEKKENHVITDPSPIRPNTNAHRILCQVVTAVITAGHASDLYEFPDVLEYFGARRDASSTSHTDIGDLFD